MRILRYCKKFEIWFLILELMALISRSVIFYDLLPAYIDSIIFSCVAILGLCVANLNFFYSKNFTNSNNFKLLLFFYFSIIISCIFNSKFGFTGNLKELVWVSINIFLLYHNYKINSKNIIFIQNLLVIIWLICSFFSLITFIFQISSFLSLKIGYIDSRLFGIFGNPNNASKISLITVIFSFFNLSIKNQKNFLKVIYKINIFIQVIYIIFSGSRVTFLAFLLLSLIYSFFHFYEIYKKVLLPVSLAILNCLVLYLILEIVKFCFSYIPYLVDDLINSRPIELRKISTSRIDLKSSGDISNLRFKIWTGALEIFKKSWFFGTSPRNVIKYAENLNPKNFIVAYNYRLLHNTYIGSLIYTGVLGSIFIFTFFIKSILNIFKKMFNFKYNIERHLFHSLSLSVIGIFFYGIFETEILFVNTICCYLFWVLLGFLS